MECKRLHSKGLEPVLISVDKKVSVDASNGGSVVELRDVRPYEEGTDHYVYGVVYVPEMIDTDGETMTAQDVKKMAHDFLASGRVKNIDLQHNGKRTGAEVVESFIARAGDPDYPEGAWVLGVRIKDGPLWEAVKRGEINGFSFAGKVNRVVVQGVTVAKARVVIGMTEENTDGPPPHTHSFYVEFDEDGQVVMGMTDEVQGHVHAILAPVVTEEAEDHAHRFFVA